MMIKYNEKPEHCENGCKFYRGWFYKTENGTKKIYLNAGEERATTSFIQCACISEVHPFRIYHNAARMLRILGCKSFEETQSQINNRPSMYENPNIGKVKVLDQGERGSDVACAGTVVMDKRTQKSYNDDDDFNAGDPFAEMKQGYVDPFY